jgi:hypothetical protein
MRGTRLIAEPLAYSNLTMSNSPTQRAEPRVGLAQDRRKAPLLRRGKLFFGTGSFLRCVHVTPAAQLWARRCGARASQASLRSLRKLGCVLANPDSITTAGDHGFRLSPLSRLGRNDRLKDLASNNTSSFPRRVFAPGVCTFASLTRKEGWAERRETFGCSAEHP